MPGQAAPDVKVVHFADPWCWWSWGLEPVLQRLREVYGDRLQVEYRMGGMCEDLDAWMKEYAVDEASTVDWIRESMALFKNALDPEYLRKSGVRSTYPACLAFKAAQRQDEHKAEKFFRRMMEVFQVQAASGTEETLLRIGRSVGLDRARLAKDLHTEEVEAAFEEDRRTMERSRANFLTPIVTTAVQNLYTEVAREPGKAFHFPLGLEALRFVGYPDEDLKQLPKTAVESFAGVGYPFATKSIRPGDTVLDVGSGSGTDALYASLLAGPRGRVIGLDFTPAMIEKARANIERMGLTHVTIVEGEATKIPLPDTGVDVVTSNGVLNLVPDKQAAFHEIFRVLRPGGLLQLADIVVQEDVGAVCGLNAQLWADCIGGAAVEADYLKTIREAGFEDLRIVKRIDYFSKSGSESTKRITKSFGAESVVISARKPGI